VLSLHEIDQRRDSGLADFAHSPEGFMTPLILVAVPERHQRDLFRFFFPEAQGPAPRHWLSSIATRSQAQRERKQQKR